MIWLIISVVLVVILLFACSRNAIVQWERRQRKHREWMEREKREPPDR